MNTLSCQELQLNRQYTWKIGQPLRTKTIAIVNENMHANSHMSNKEPHLRYQTKLIEVHMAF